MDHYKIKRNSFHSLEKIKVFPNSCSFVKIKPKFPVETLVEIEPSFKLQNQFNIFAANSLYDPKDKNSHKILIANYNEKPITIFNGQIVGYVSPDKLMIYNTEFKINQN